MANRKRPFGYEMRQGVVRVKTAEASVVKDIFASYIKGMSYRQIMDRMNAQSVAYSDPDKPWNKNMVARILGCELYTGNDLYPAILTAEEYRCAASAKPVVGSQFDGKAKAIRQLARCSACGSALTLSGNKYGWARWNCPSCDTISADAVMPDTINALSQILTAVIRNPQLIQIPTQLEQSMTKVPDQLENEFDLAIHAEPFNESEARAKAFSLAAARFDALGSEDYETMRIQYILAGAEQNDELNIELLRQITSAILIHPNGAVSLKLKNGQIMERTDQT